MKCCFTFDYFIKSLHLKMTYLKKTEKHCFFICFIYFCYCL